MKVFLCLALCVAVALAEPPLYRQQQQQRYYFARQREETTQAAASGPYPPRGWKPDGPAFNLPERQQQAPAQVDTGYGAPAQPQQQYGPPAQPQQQYGPPAQPQQQYGPPAQPQQQYGPPAQPQQQYGPPAQPQQQYGPAKQQYGPASQPQVSVFQPQFSRQQQPQNQYGAAQQQQLPQNQYGAPDFNTESTQEIEEPTTVGPLADSEPASPSSVSEFQDDAEAEAGSSDAEARQNQESGQYYVALPDGRLQRVQYVSQQDIEAMRYFAKIQAENVEPLRGPIYAYAPLQKLEVTAGALAVSPAAASGLGVTASERKPEKLVGPKVDIKPLAQLQIQHDAPQPVVPLSSSYTTYTANYQVPAAPVDNRFILALP